MTPLDVLAKFNSRSHNWRRDMRKSTIVVLLYYLCFIVFYIPLAFLYTYIDEGILKYQLSQATKSFYEQYCKESVNIKAVEISTEWFSGTWWEAAVESKLMSEIQGKYENGTATLSFMAGSDRNICSINKISPHRLYLDRIHMKFVSYQNYLEAPSPHLVPILLNISGVLTGLIVYGVLRIREDRSEPHM